jgi:hypothetical protein
MVVFRSAAVGVPIWKPHVDFSYLRVAGEREHHDPVPVDLDVRFLPSVLYAGHQRVRGPVAAFPLKPVTPALKSVAADIVGRIASGQKDRSHALAAANVADQGGAEKQQVIVLMSDDVQRPAPGAPARRFTSASMRCCLVWRGNVGSLA